MSIFPPKSELRPEEKGHQVRRCPFFCPKARKPKKCVITRDVKKRFFRLFFFLSLQLTKTKKFVFKVKQGNQGQIARLTSQSIAQVVVEGVHELLLQFQKFATVLLLKIFSIGLFYSKGKCFKFT